MDPEDHYGSLTTIENGKAVRKVHPTIQPPTYAEYYRTFAKALKGEGEVPVKPEDARNVLRIIELAKQSSNAGKTLDVDLVLA